MLAHVVQCLKDFPFADGDMKRTRLFAEKKTYTIAQNSNTHRIAALAHGQNIVMAAADEVRTTREEETPQQREK
jgi:hypothetical protein